MKSVAISTILGVVAAAAFAGTALVAPAQPAHAGKGGSARATTTGSKINTGMRAAPKLTCVGPYCSRRPSENKATTTGTNKASGNKASTWTAEDPAKWPGGVKVSGGRTRVVGAPLPRCTSRYPRKPCYRPWGSDPGAKVRDHRGPPVVEKEDPRQKW